MFAIFAGMSIIALGYPEKARFLPLLIGVPAAVMAFTQLVFDIRKNRATPRPKPSAEELARRGREVKMFVWFGLFVAGILAFGFVYAAPVLVFAFLKFGEKESWQTAMIGALGAWAILYGVFVKLLELFLFDGLVIEFITG